MRASTLSCPSRRSTSWPETSRPTGCRHPSSRRRRGPTRPPRRTRSAGRGGGGPPRAGAPPITPPPSGADPSPAAHPLGGSWRGDHVEVVAAGRARQAAAAKDLLALDALGGNDQTAYWYVMDEFQDISAQVGEMVAGCPEV